MRRIALCSHGSLAAGMKSSLEMIAGPQSGVRAVCAYLPDSPDLSETLSDMVRDLAPADELVIVTDVLGGSVNTEASQFAGARGVTVVTGMNLGFVLSLVLGDAPTTAQLVDECLEGARAQLLRIEPAASEDEEF